MEAAEEKDGFGVDPRLTWGNRALAGPRVLTILGLCGLLLAGSAQARERGASPWFTAFTLSVGAADLHASSHRGSIGTGTIIDGIRDGDLVHRAEYDVVAGIGGSFGWRQGAWQLESEVLWRPRTDWDLAAPTPSLRTVTNVETNIANTTVLLNASRQLGRIGRWQLRVGAGAGVALNEFSSRYKERAAPGLTEAFTTHATRRSQRLAWNLSLGAERPLGARWIGSVRYRYLDLGTLDAGPYPERDAQLRGRHSTHELQFRFVRFGR